ncbi:MAG: DUF72 domain-containing protein [Candidatus Thermoplasmatota archaeon]|jgi:uncharacterized protein YecE (DUF72 family)|nr:DUF72 domain-containing protein [Candidatus Thermoplasmatota archaeon]MCL5984701.1 DUF72 domain-containing protein [Candidatus Thermoplasmatota archaeon]
MDAGLRIGCSSWTSDAWWGRIYPKEIRPGDRLALYSKVYDTVEVDSSYYRDPGSFLLHRWRTVTPENFVFTLKFPRDLMDIRKPLDTEKIHTFLKNVEALGPKLGALLLQFPPWVRPGKATKYLDSLLEILDPRFRYSIELRSAEWFSGSPWEDLRKRLSDRQVALAWSYLTYVEIPPELTSDFVYLRFIGDHSSIPAETHGEIRQDRTQEMRQWARRLQEVEDRTHARYVYFNNHFQGFAPESVNLFRKELGLPSLRYDLAMGPAPRSEGTLATKGA